MEFVAHRYPAHGDGCYPEPLREDTVFDAGTFLQSPHDGKVEVGAVGLRLIGFR